jgi:hypothetical protein
LMTFKGQSGQRQAHTMKGNAKSELWHAVIIG